MDIGRPPLRVFNKAGLGNANAMASFLAIVAVTLWGLSFVATKMCLDYLTPAQIIAARFVLALPFLYALAARQRLSFRPSYDYWKIFLVCGIILAIHLLIQVEGMKTTTASNTAWLMTTIPVFIVVLSRIFLRERLRLRQMLGMGLAAVGVLFLISRGRLESLDFIRSYGDWLVLGSCLTWSVYTILSKKVSSQSPLAIIVIILTISGAFIVPPTIMAGGLSPFLHLPVKIILALVYLGVFCFGIAYWCWTEALRLKPAGEVGAYLYLEPLSTMVAAPILLGESITGPLIIGAAMIVAGVWLVERKGRPA